MDIKTIIRRKKTEKQQKEGQKALQNEQAFPRDLEVSADYSPFPEIKKEEKKK